MREIGVGLIGFGTVGAGVVDGMLRNGALMATRLGAVPVLRAVADLDVETDRGVAIDPALLTTDVESVVARDDVDIVVELIGGTGFAGDVVMNAMRNGKAVVTANKALLAERGDEIFGVARELGGDLRPGASVGGGIPIIRCLRDGLVGNRIAGIRAILNGTCNYIVTRMEDGGLSFDVALQEAQDAGYAEADPSLDIDGLDTAHKALILARLAYGVPVRMSDIRIEGLRGMASEDMGYARDLGYRIKLMAIIREDDREVEVRVHPALVPLDHVMASVSGVFNAVMVSADLAGDTLYYGRGAGREPTASTVLADIGDAARGIAAGGAHGIPVRSDSSYRLKPMGDIETRYYLRFSLLDKPGTLAHVASVLGEHGISIASVLQTDECSGAHVPVVVVTHRARESGVGAALAAIEGWEAVDSRTVMMRIED